MSEQNSGNQLSFTLFSVPSFIKGFGQSIDMSGTREIYNESTTPEEADKNALLNDWKAIGFDLKKAIDLFAVQNG